MMLINPKTVTLEEMDRAALRPAIEARRAFIAKRLDVLAQHAAACKGGQRVRDTWRMERSALESQDARLADLLTMIQD